MSVGEIVAAGHYEGERQGNMSLNYLVREENGDLIEVNGCGTLKHKMAMPGQEVKIGDYIVVEYAGMDKLTKGKWAGKTAHSVKLFRDRSKDLNNPQKNAIVTESTHDLAKKESLKSASEKFTGELDI
jgi:hypothetical protein